MSRTLVVAAAQMGPVTLAQSRAAVIARILDLMTEAAAAGAELVVLPEAALTPFFPHWLVRDEQELDGYFEPSMPHPGVAAVFETAARLGVGLYLGYCERVAGNPVRRYNSAILVDRDGSVAGRYRKIHLPGYRESDPTHPFQNLEKRYFDVGDLGFGVWDACGARIGMCLCNDRRWPETYRVMALRGAEMILLGYNTPIHNPDRPETDRLADFHNTLSMQGGAYANGVWVVGVAKAGVEEGVEQIGGSCVIAPNGEIVAQARSLDDEIVVARCDLDLSSRYQPGIVANRRPEHYGAVTAVPPPTDS